jgi:hypothetical protein
MFACGGRDDCVGTARGRLMTGRCMRNCSQV